jgi:thymidylate kinase
MLDTKLILIEGLPGAGKSTSTDHLGKVLQQQGIPCRQYQEEDDPHPLPGLDYDIKTLDQTIVPLWVNFTKQAVHESVVTIIESRLWQNTALFMFMSEMDVEEIIKFHRQVWQVLTPLSPVLLYLDQPDTETALRRMYAARGEKWMEWALGETTQYPWFKTRGLNDFAGWVKFFEEWHLVAERLYEDWPHRKIKILDPHEDWARAYEQMLAFLHIEQVQAKRFGK